MPVLSIIDAHAHVIQRICGTNRYGALSPVRCGRVKRGETEVPMLPASCLDCTFPVEALIESMDREGVAQAVLLQNPTLGLCNEYIRECVERFPDRFCGTLQADPRCADAAATLRAFASPKQRTFKLEMSYDWGWTGIYPGFRMDEPCMDPMWEAVADLGLEVIVDPGPPGNPGYQIEELSGLTERMQGTRFVLEHLGYLLAEQWEDAAARAQRQRLLELALRPNVWLGLSAAPVLLNDSHSCSRTDILLREAVEKVGASKLIWGSDIPTTLNRHTYRQLIDTVAEGSSFLSPSDRKRILHDNAKAVFAGLN